MPKWVRRLAGYVPMYLAKQLEDVPDEQVDEFVARYADMMVQLRSEGAVPMRVVAGDDEALKAFAYFQAHRDEIMALIPAQPEPDETPARGADETPELPASRDD